MSLDAIEIETAPNPTAAIIVLHGLGADGNDFVPMARELRLESVGPVRFVFPHAPVRPVTINGGYRMRAWYDILGTELGTPGAPRGTAAMREDETGLRASQALVEALIAAQKAHGIAASRIVLAGFSQGCAMTFATGLRHAERLGGLLGLSGYLPLAGHLVARTQPGERRRADLPGARHAGRRDPDRAGDAIARCARRDGVRGRMARLPDGALGEPR